MKKATIALCLSLLSAPLFAGVTYQFKSSTDGAGGTTLAGKASVEGPNMRLDFAKGDKLVFKDSSVVISKNGGETMMILDPVKKTYFEFALKEIFGVMGTALKSMGGMFKLSISNESVKAREAGSGGLVEGFPTKKYVIETAYDLDVKVMGMSSKSKIHTVNETWSTDKLDPAYMTFVQQKGFKTGMEDLDRLIATQLSSVKGFPLKQIITSTTTSNGKTQKSTTTMTITEVKQGTVPASAFVVPAGYRKEEAPVFGLPKAASLASPQALAAAK